MKVNWRFKLAAFVGSVISLSWFFAGWRMINQTGELTGWLTLGGGTGLTILLVGLQGYWIYLEEKASGRLRRRVDLYERIHAAMSAGSKSPAAFEAPEGEPND